MLFKKRIFVLTVLTVSSLACKCVFYRLEHKAKEVPMDTEIWVSWNSKIKKTNEQSSKIRWKKWCNLSRYHVYSPIYSLGKFFKCIWKILSSSFRKCYRLLGFEQPFARYYPLKIQKFRISLRTQKFFDIPFLNISQTVTPKHINHTIFWKNSIKCPRGTETFWLHVINSLLSSAENTKIEPFLTFWWP